jgi:hypothetical protein
MAKTKIPGEYLVDGGITVGKMAANSVDSDQYVDGSIDLIHMSVNSIDSDQYVDGSIDTIHIADGAITSAKLDTNIAVGGTLTVTGDANFDSNTLFVDASANAVGIGTSSPAAPLDVVSTLGSTGVNIRGRSADNIGSLYFTSNADASTEYGFVQGRPTDLRISGFNNGLILQPNGGNVGIGLANPSDYYAENLVVAAAAEGGITIKSASTDHGYLMFADGTSGSDAYRGYLSHAHAGDATNLVSFGTINLSSVNETTFSTNSTERLRILSGGGITFNGDTAAANALDDYEEGTWTPNIQRSGGTIPATFAIVSATYVKIGNIVHAKTYIGSLSNGSSDGTSYWIIYNIPFAAQVEDYSGVALAYNSSPCNTTYVGDAGGNAILCVGAAPYTGSLSGEFMLNITYRVN